MEEKKVITMENRENECENNDEFLRKSLKRNLCLIRQKDLRG